MPTGNTLFLLPSAIRLQGGNIDWHEVLMPEDHRHFDKWAGEYDEHISVTSDSFPFVGYYDVLEAIRREVEPSEGMKILDVGIGTALLSSELARAGCVVFGVDFSPKMLERARKKIPDARLALADVAKERFGEFNSLKFDRIVSSYFLHHLSPDQKLDFFKSITASNLNDGGKIIIGDIGFPDRVACDSARAKWEHLWDDSEYYLIGETITEATQDIGINASYRQISECAGLLIVEK